MATVTTLAGVDELRAQLRGDVITPEDAQYHEARKVYNVLLGGGVGHLTRKYGLSIDNVLGVDMVLADGSFVRASEDENADLFWAVRGGGGNFGVVTALTVQLHQVSTVIAGPILWPIDAA